MYNYMLRILETQNIVIEGLTEVNKILLSELEQYRTIEEENERALMRMKEIEDRKTDLDELT